jgi:hypothetical protein
MDSLTYVLSEEICKAVHDVAPAYGVTDLEAFATDILVYMGIQSRTAGAAVPMTPEKKIVAILPDAPKKEKKEEEETNSTTSAKKSRSRTISKKMKESFIALGGTEEQLKELTKKYKDATDAQLEALGGTFEAFARDFLGLEKETTKSSKKTAKKTVSRISWTPTPKKMFKEIVEGSGGAYTDDLKNEFTAFLDAMTNDDFKALSVEGHMRAFAVSRFAPPTPVLSRNNATMDGAEESKEDDEDLEEFTHEDETLLIGVKTGKIYRSTEEAGDVLIGVAGQGRFAGVKVPSA